MAGTSFFNVYCFPYKAYRHYKAYRTYRHAFSGDAQLPEDMKVEKGLTVAQMKLKLAHIGIETRLFCEKSLKNGCLYYKSCTLTQKQPSTIL